LEVLGPQFSAIYSIGKLNIHFVRVTIVRLDNLLRHLVALNGFIKSLKLLKDLASCLECEDIQIYNMIVML
jgi:hypothetical protein